MSNPSQVIRGIFTLGIGQLVSWIGAIVLTIVLPKYLGDANLGKFAFAWGVIELTGLIADLGASVFITKELARTPERAPKVIGNALAMRLPLGLAAAVLTIGIVNAASPDAITTQTAYVLCIGVFLGAINGVVNGALQAFLQMKVMAASSVISKLSYAALSGLLLANGGGPIEVAAAYVTSQAIGLTLNAVGLSRCTRVSICFERASWQAITYGALPFFVWQASVVVYGQIDKVILALLTHDAVVGWYAAAYRIIMIPAFVPGIIMAVMFPSLSAASRSPALFAALARQALRAVVLINTPFVLGIMILPDHIMDLFGYPESFRHSIPPVLILAPHILVVSIDMILGAVLITRDRERAWAIAGVAAAILNPIANLIAIPATQSALGNGAVGAATVTTLTEIFMLCVAVTILPRGVLGRATLVDLARCSTAGAIMAAVVWSLRDLALAVPVVVGAVVYGVSCLSIGAVSLRDISEVRLHLRRRESALATT